MPTSGTLHMQQDHVSNRLVVGGQAICYGQSGVTVSSQWLSGERIYGAWCVVGVQAARLLIFAIETYICFNSLLSGVYMILTGGQD
jgi:hypothetical protein